MEDNKKVTKVFDAYLNSTGDKLSIDDFAEFADAIATQIDEASLESSKQLHSFNYEASFTSGSGTGFDQSNCALSIGFTGGDIAFTGLSGSVTGGEVSAKIAGIDGQIFKLETKNINIEKDVLFFKGTAP
jgi:hypothetical protein